MDEFRALRGLQHIVVPVAVDAECRAVEVVGGGVHHFRARSAGVCVVGMHVADEEPVELELVLVGSEVLIECRKGAFGVGPVGVDDLFLLIVDRSFGHVGVVADRLKVEAARGSHQCKGCGAAEYMSFFHDCVLLEVNVESENVALAVGICAPVDTLHGAAAAPLVHFRVHAGVVGEGDEVGGREVGLQA